MRGTPPTNLNKCKTAYWRISYAQFIFIMKLKAKLKQPIQVSRQDGTVEKLDRRTALTYLHKHKKGSRYEYWFCVRKFHGSGLSGIGLFKNEFDWVR